MAILEARPVVSLPQRLNSLSAQNAQLRADIVQLRLEATGAALLGCPSKGSSSQACRFTSHGTFRTHSDVVSGICVSTANVVATCSWDASIALFDLTAWSEGRRRLRLDPEGANAARSAILAVAVSPCSFSLVGCASQDTSLRLWNTETGATHALRGHDLDVFDLDFHPKQAAVMCSGSADRRAVVWDCQQAVQVRSLNQHGGEVFGVRFLGANATYDRTAATACADQLVRLWDLRAPSLQCALPVPADHRCAIAAHATNHVLAAGTDRREIITWDLRMLKELRLLQLKGGVDGHGFKGEVTSLAFSPCCTYLAAGSSDGEVLAFDLQNQSLQAVCEHDDAVMSLAWGAPWPWRADSVPFLLCASHDASWSCWTPAPTVSSNGTSATRRWLGPEAA
eukprot:gnl/TRDRNA2_/TRDRNA2_197510_c0_seq1.p1 gnl/TRDRNA2_/TRDRNA2_197510_c0~~gnl/TRDRNA2_/TRDRNA2_197510_c0_seq1.p1  ORF type:complete len:396 (+),score=34.91 gnl/TRDRNA2_/TRDRNA2_197510_c0_seq1:74-1261(+)